MGYEMVIDDESTAPLPMGAAPLRTGGHVALGAHDPPELFAETSFGPRPASVTGIGHYNEADGELRVLAS
jgi:hypothetical protein